MIKLLSEIERKQIHHRYRKVGCYGTLGRKAV